jgi:iron complex outermembrane receptor protein
VKRNARRRSVPLGRLAASLLAAYPLLHASASLAGEVTLGEVNVTSTTIDDRFASKRAEPSSTADISAKQVDERRPENMINLLQSIPGVTADLSSGDEIKIKFRGVENQVYMGEKPGVAIVIDGVPVFERTGKVNVDLDNIESIKVIKGGASYLFGEDALAGAVVVTTKRGAKYAGASASVDAGAWGYQRELLRFGKAGDWGSAHIQATRRRADDYYFQSGYKTDYIDGSVRFYLGDSSDLTINAEQSKRFKDKHGNVTGALQASLDPTGTLGRDYARRFDVDLDKLNATYLNDLKNLGTFQATLYRYHDHTVFWSAPQNYAPAATASASPNGIAVTANDAYTTNNDYHQTQTGGKGEWRNQHGEWGWMTGVDLRRNEYLNTNTALTDYCSSPACNYVNRIANVITKGSVFQNDRTDERTRAVYGELKWSGVKDWVFTGNLRADRIGLDYTGLPNRSVSATINKSADFSNRSWRLGSTWQQGSSDVFANISTGFRIPTAAQLYAGSISPTGATANNENLKTETSKNYEIGVRSDSEAAGLKFNVQASLFEIDRKNYIMATQGDYGGGGSVALGQKYDNIGGARNRGLELALKTDARRDWSVDVAYTYVEARFAQYDNVNQILGNQYGTAWVSGTFNPASQYKLVHFNNTGKGLPRVPRNQLFSTVHWRPLGGLQVGLEIDAKQWAYADEINQEKLPGRTLFNLATSYDVNEGKPAWLGGKWSLFARVDNLFSRSYWQIARGTNDAKGYVAGSNSYNGVYNGNDLSIIVGKPRGWSVGANASF